MKRLLLCLTIIFSNYLISQNITVINPNGGEQISGCTNYTISWNSSGTSSYYNVDYSTDGGNTWSSIRVPINQILLFGVFLIYIQLPVCLRFMMLMMLL